MLSHGANGVTRGVSPDAARTHFVSVLHDIPPDKPLVCKCRPAQHTGADCPDPKADRDWGRIDTSYLITEESLAKIIAEPPPPDAKLISKQNLAAWVPGEFNGRRSNDTAVSRSILGLDFDHVRDRDALLAQFRSLGLRTYVHASFRVRNEDGTWRMRAYIFLDRPATPEEWSTRVAPWALATFPDLDRGTREIARLFFLPVAVDGYWYELIEGKPLEVDTIPVFPAARTTANGPNNRSTNAGDATSADEVEPAWLAAVPHEQRERDAAAYLARIPKEGEGDGSGQLVRLAATVVRGFAVGVEAAVRIMGEAPIGDDWSDEEIRRRCLDVHRAKRRELGFKYKPNPLQEHFATKRAETAASSADAPAELGGERHESASVASEAAAPKRMSVAERARRVGGEGVRLPTGFPTIDTATRGGILLRKVVCVGGAPGAGKTATCVQLAFRWLGAGIVVGFMCADEDADAILIRFGQLAGLSREKLEAGDPEERERLASWAEGVPFYLYDGDEDGTTIESVSAELRALASEQPSALFVDSIQTARTTAQAPKGADMRARTNVVVQALKTAAKVGGHLVVATSELSKAAYRSTAQGEINLLSAFKESGDIEYGVSLALVLTSRSGTSEIVDGVVVKNRLGHGKPGLALHLDHARAHVVETSADEADFRTDLADRSKELRDKILDALRRGPARTQDEIASRVKRTAAHVRAEVRALIVERQIVNLPGQGYTLDTPEARRKRIEDAVGASLTAGYTTLTKLASAALVDGDELQKLATAGELATSGKGFVLARR